MQRPPYNVLAEYQAYERFLKINRSSDATAWSQTRENELAQSLSRELGDRFGQLQVLSLLMNPHPVPEKELLDTIMASR